VIQWDGDYFVVPSHQTDRARATLGVIPKSEIISMTMEAVEPQWFRMPGSGVVSGTTEVRSSGIAVSLPAMCGVRTSTSPEGTLQNRHRRLRTNPALGTDLMTPLDTLIAALLDRQERRNRSPSTLCKYHSTFASRRAHCSASIQSPEPGHLTTAIAHRYQARLLHRPMDARCHDTTELLVRCPFRAPETERLDHDPESNRQEYPEDQPR
jgi:hypothetical protein